MSWQLLLLTETPELPFEEVASDLFEFEGRLLVDKTTDYYSKFIETAAERVAQLNHHRYPKSSVQHSIPTTLRTDNCPQYSSEEFKNFCESYGIHKTSSPHTPLSNSEAEHAMQKLWCKAPDKHLSLLDYKTTPLESVSLSPAQKLMGRRPWNKLPTAWMLLKPTAYNPLSIKSLLDRSKGFQMYYDDHKSIVNACAALKPGDDVRMQMYPGNQLWSPGATQPPHGHTLWSVETSNTDATFSTSTTTANQAPR